MSYEARSHHLALEALAAQRGCRLIDLVLGFAREQLDLEAVVLGVCSIRELTELLQAWERISPWQKGEWSSWALQDSSILDPRFWKR